MSDLVVIKEAPPRATSGKEMYQQLDEYLGKRQDRKSKRGVQTRIYRINNSVIGVMYWSTYVVRISDDGRIMLNSGGHQSNTTKDRMCEYMPIGYSVFQRNWNWFVNIHHWHQGPDLDEWGYPEWHDDSDVTHEYRDFMVIMPDDTVVYDKTPLNWLD